MLVWTLVALVVAASCSGTSDATAPQSVSNLVLNGPDTLIVHERLLLKAVAPTASGEVVIPPSSITFSSSNSSVATVSDDGVIAAAGRGTATIAATYGTVAARLTVTVRARVVVIPALGIPPDVQIYPGDTLRLEAVLADVNGSEIGPALTIGWSSDNPRFARVDSTGLVFAVGEGKATITASAPDRRAAFPVNVGPARSTPPNTVRFAHALPGVGPLTFTSGGVDALTTTAWSLASTIQADKGCSRFIQRGNFPVLHLLDPGSSSGVLVQCYFDMGTFTSYFGRPAGAFDLLLTMKVGMESSARLSATLPAGHAITVVLTGGSPGYLFFTDR